MTISPYLAFLAHHLEHRLQTTGLAWWELSRATPRALSIFAVGLMGGVVGGSGSASPRQVALRRPQLSDLPLGLTGGLVAGLVFGLTAGLTSGLVAGLTAGLLGLAAGIGLESAADTRRAADPRTVLVQDRTSALLLSLVFGPVFGLAFGLVIWFADGLPFGLAFGLALLLTNGLADSLLGSAWGQLGLARLWLAARRQQPLRLIEFIADAHDRGVLRQAGAVWEFRHANLQRHLAQRP